MGYQPDFDILSLIVIATIIGILWFLGYIIYSALEQKKLDKNKLKYYRELELEKEKKLKRKKYKNKKK
tara:strand:+ start:20 stop:223 length:204 start_codon:yes stop_codon:yes gene_type:complete